MPPAKTSHVCLPCRSSFKLARLGPGEPARRCPGCAEPMTEAGAAFQPPRRRDAAGWRTLSVLLNAGIRFHTDCCDEGPGYRPRTLFEVRERMTYARRTGEPFARALVRRELP